MKINKITGKQFNLLLDRTEILEQKNIDLIKNLSKIKVILGGICFAIAVIPNGLGFIFYPLSFFLLGWSLFDIKNIYWPEWKRKIVNKLRGRN